MALAMEKITALVILTVALLSATLLSVSEGKSFENTLGQYGHLDTPDLNRENNRGSDDQHIWDAVRDDEGPQQEVMEVGDGDLIRLLLQQQALVRKQPNLLSGAARNGPEFKAQISGISGARNKKRQILYRQCFFNPIACF